MDIFNYEKTIEHQFDSFCKTVLRNHARNIYAEIKRSLETKLVLAVTIFKLGQTLFFMY